MEYQRFFLFAALALVLMLIWQSWTEYNQPVTPSGTPSAQSQPVTGTGQPAVNDVPVAPTVPAATAAAVAPPQPAAEAAAAGGQRVTVETDLLKVHLDTLGAGLRDVWLIQYPVEVDQPDHPFQLMQDQGADLFYTQGGLIGSAGELPNHKTLYTAERTSYRLDAGQDTVSVPFHWVGPDGVDYQKVYTFHRNSYIIDVAYRIKNTTDHDWSGYQYAQFLRTDLPQANHFGMFGRLPIYKGAAIYTPAEKYEKVSFSKLEKKNLAVSTDSGWVAMLQHYFVGAWLPPASGDYQFYSTVHPNAGGTRYNVGYKTVKPTTIAAGASGTIDSRLYVGPTERKRLTNAATGLQLTVDYGWFTPIASPMFTLLHWIYDVVGNWGWSIILLTMLIKLVFFPLSAASYKSMAKMKRLQPRLKTLKERFGDDRQRYQQAMMEMYKKEKINPAGGCLPIVVQIPVFYCLYWVLLESVELRQAPFMLWIHDLSVPDPYYVLPLLMGVSMLAQQFLNPAPMEKIQRYVMMGMPVAFTFFFLWFPAGLVLYWVVNNVLSITQQWYITQKIAK